MSELSNLKRVVKSGEERMLKTEQCVTFGHYRPDLPFLHCKKSNSTLNLLDKVLVNDLHSVQLAIVFLFADIHLNR